METDVYISDDKLNQAIMEAKAAVSILEALLDITPGKRASILQAASLMAKDPVPDPEETDDDG